MFMYTSYYALFAKYEEEWDILRNIFEQWTLSLKTFA